MNFLTPEDLAAWDWMEEIWDDYMTPLWNYGDPLMGFPALDDGTLATARKISAELQSLKLAFNAQPASFNKSLGNVKRAYSDLHMLDRNNNVLGEIMAKIPPSHIYLRDFQCLFDLRPSILLIQNDIEFCLEMIRELVRLLAGCAKVGVELLLLNAAHVQPLAGFPGNIRPRCTTMPWTIWPALVVLWGVCWMFYSPSENLDFNKPAIVPQPSPSVDGASRDYEFTEFTFPITGVDGFGGLGGDLQFDIGWIPPVQEFEAIDPMLLQTLVTGESGMASEAPGVYEPTTELPNSLMASPAFQLLDFPTSTLSFDLVAGIGGEIKTQNHIGSGNPREGESLSPLSSYPLCHSLHRCSSTNICNSSQMSDKAFKCPDCEKSFTRKWALDRHHEQLHRGKLYACTFPNCRRAPFNREENLQRHLKTHERKRKRERLDQVVPPPGQASKASPRLSHRKERGQENGSNRQKKRSMPENTDDTMSNEMLLSVLKKKYTAQSEALEAKRRELQAEMDRKLQVEVEKLERLGKCIQDLE